MSDPVVALLMLGLFIFVIFLGFPIAFTLMAMGISFGYYAYFTSGQSFWDNRDWDWYKQNVPFFECPDAEITTTYYYRWELVTKHLVYGSPETGYTFTEFIDRPSWSGAYGAISCPLGHQHYEVRWLKDRRIIDDFATGRRGNIEGLEVDLHEGAGRQPRGLALDVHDEAAVVRLEVEARGVRGGPRSAGSLMARMIRNWPAPSKFSSARPIGSVILWHPAHTGSVAWAASLCRAVERPRLASRSKPVKSTWPGGAAAGKTSGSPGSS